MCIIQLYTYCLVQVMRCVTKCKVITLCHQTLCFLGEGYFYIHLFSLIFFNNHVSSNLQSMFSRNEQLINIPLQCHPLISTCQLHHTTGWHKCESDKSSLLKPYHTCLLPLTARFWLEVSIIISNSSLVKLVDPSLSHE